jgi:chromosome segregation ATPase
LETQSSITELSEKISDIKLKASQSEKMVQEICADIKKLDYAKNNLQTSITSLNRLQMLISAVAQLEASYIYGLMCVNSIGIIVSILS